MFTQIAATPPGLCFGSPNSSLKKANVGQLEQRLARLAISNKQINRSSVHSSGGG